MEILFGFFFLFGFLGKKSRIFEVFLDPPLSLFANECLVSLEFNLSRNPCPSPNFVNTCDPFSTLALTRVR